MGRSYVSTVFLERLCFNCTLRTLYTEMEISACRFFFFSIFFFENDCLTTTLWLHRFEFIKNPFEFAKKCHVKKIKIQSETYIKPILSKLELGKIFKKCAYCS